MKRILVAGLVGIMALGLVGCGDDLTDRERECLKLTGNLQCKSEAELALEAQKVQAQADIRQAEIQAEVVDDQADLAEAQMAAQPDMMQQQQAMQPRNIDYGPVQPGNYTNYYGNPQYGQWMPNGQFQFFDPFGHAAQSTNAFLLGAGLGGLTGYLATKAAMRSDWNRSNPRGWSSHSWKNDKYMYKGKSLNKNEALRRMEQSNRDRAAQQTKLKQQLKQQQIKIQNQQNQLKDLQKQKQQKQYQTQPKKPNYMVQPRTPPKPGKTGLNLSKPQPKSLNLSKPTYKPTRKSANVSYFSGKSKSNSYKSSSYKSSYKKRR